MLTRAMRADLGVMISASHNPFEDNGIKLFGPDGYKLSDVVEADIEALIDAPVSGLAKSADLGRAIRVDSVNARYVEFAKRSLGREMSFEGLRVVLDCANGAGYRVAPEALWELGAEVINIGNTPDGMNINREVGSTEPLALQRKVSELRADIGIALDGDADRVLIVDEKGDTIDGDQIMALIAGRWAQEGRLARPGIVATVMSNLGLERYLKSVNLSLDRTAVGDRHVLQHMRAHGFNVGGEQSGHVILSDFTTTGDGLIAALQVIAAVVQSGKRASEVCRVFEPLPQILTNVRFAPCEMPAVTIIDEAGAIGAARLGNHGRLLVRSSGTEPVVRVMGEGDDEALVTKAVDEACAALRDMAARMSASGLGEPELKQAS
jgi:phosphoglucosamine mutase